MSLLPDLKQAVSLEPVLNVFLQAELKQLNAYPVRLGDGQPPALLVSYSACGGIDPWAEAFYFPTDTLKFALVTQEGEILWRRDIGKGVIPGFHFCPVAAFDLDGDGVDEIWYVNNVRVDNPLSLNGRRLECVSPANGETIGQWEWPNHAGATQNLSHSHRNFIFGGYAKGDAVLVTGQGTYGPMFLQGWKPDMTQRWDVRIGKDDPGARGTHPTVPVLDINNEGVDEVLWGERCIELGSGRELFCADRDVYRGHSDHIQPFKNPETGQTYIYTIREGDPEAKPRVVTFDNQGNRVWGRIDEGHMDMGWVGKIGEGGAPVAAAIRIESKNFTIEGVEYGGTAEFVFDALTGEDVSLPFSPYRTKPKDINNDGYDELIRGNEILDRYGAVIGQFEGRGRRMLDLSNYQGLQIVTHTDEGEMVVWTDKTAISC